ncbi:hypothetical protein Ahia01_001124200, partial [Argonauta hians]
MVSPLLDYWDRLKLYSTHRRWEHYTIFTMSKIFHHHYPNDTGIQFKIHTRLGPLRKSKSHRIGKLQHNLFTSIGPALFNIVPGHITQDDPD